MVIMGFGINDQEWFILSLNLVRNGLKDELRGAGLDLPIKIGVLSPLPRA